MKYHIELDLEFRKNNDKGIYIALEGIDGSGKTTQAEELTKYFESKGKKVVKTREPRKEGIVGDIIRDVLIGKIKIPLKAVQYLFTTDRVIHYEEVILPALKEGKIVISDRSFWSAVVYGILDKEEQYNELVVDHLLVSQSILSFYHQFTIPDYTFYLKIPLEESLKRIEGKHKTDAKEIYEEKDKIGKVTKGYDWLFEQFKKEIITIDGTKSVEKVRNEIIKKIKL